MKRAVTFIHCADIHLDAPFQSLEREDFSRQRRKDLKKTLERIVTLALDKDIDYLIISGDLYEHQYASSATIRWVDEQFKRLGDKPVIMVPGNHDPYVKNSWYHVFPWQHNVHILTTSVPCYLDEERDVLFFGIGFDAFRQVQLPPVELPELSMDRINLCLFHGTIDMNFTQQAYNPIGLEELKKMGFDCYAVGHFHKRNEGLEKEGILNPGSPEPLGFDEQGEHGVYRVCLSKEEDRVQRDILFIPLQQRRYSVLHLDVGGMESETQVREALGKSLEAIKGEEHMIKVLLTGLLPSDLKLETDEWEREFESECFFLTLEDNTRSCFNIQALRKEKNIAGLFTDRMIEKISRAGDEEKPVLKKALDLGLKALLEGRVEL